MWYYLLESFQYILYILLLTACSKDLTTTPTQQVLFKNDLKTNLDSIVHSYGLAYMQKTNSVGFTLAVIDTSNIYTYYYGETKKGNGILPDANTLYEIGSVTKTFTSIALVHWLNKQGISLDNPIKDYLPSELRNSLQLNTFEISFRHLLNHTSGFERVPSDLPNTNDPYQGYDSVKIYHYIQNHNLLRNPGTKPQSEAEAYQYYSNIAYGLAGLIIERQTGKSLGEYMRNCIFNTCNMKSTGFDSIENKLNIAYPMNPYNNAGYWHFTGMKGAGGLKSNLNDLIGYVQYQIKADSSTELGRACVMTHQPQIQINAKDYFGLGWEFLYTDFNKRVMVKDGGTGGFTAYIAIDKISKKGVIALFNNNSDNKTYEPFLGILNNVISK